MRPRRSDVLRGLVVVWGCAIIKIWESRGGGIVVLWGTFVQSDVWGMGDKLLAMGDKLSWRGWGNVKGRVWGVLL